MFRDPITGEMKDGIAEVRYTHEECIKILVAEPFIRQNELAARFKVTPSWMSTVMRSDAFQARLKEVKDLTWGPVLTELKEKVQTAAHASLDRLLEKLEHPGLMKEENVIKTAELLLKATGHIGAADRGSGGAQVIINLPNKAPSEEAWASRYSPSPGGISDAIEVKAGTPGPG